VTEAYKSSAVKFPQQLAVSCRYWAFLPSSPIYLGTPMYNNPHDSAENSGNKYLASNQVVGSSSLSGRAKFIKHLTHFRKFESSNRFLIFKVVIDGWGTIVGSVCVSS